MYRLAFIAGLAAALAGCAPQIPPAGNYATVSGKVTDAATGTALEGATVNVNGVLTVTTDASGTYRITPVPSGPWSYSASAAGYRDKGDAQPVPLAPGEQRVLAIALTKS